MTRGTMNYRSNIRIVGRIAGSLALKLLAVACMAMFLAAMFSSCAAEESAGADRNPVLSTGSAVVFSVTDGDSTTLGATRTARNTLTLTGSEGSGYKGLQTTGFGVFACHTGIYRYVSTSTTSDLMWNQQVGYSGGHWTYSPLVYWPNADDGTDEYVTFFAYGPYSNGSSGDAAASVIDFSDADAKGDPWLLYQLAGTPDDWQGRQVDLVYDFRKDQKRAATTATTVTFSFKHALSVAGDQVTLACGESVKDKLKALYTSSGGNTAVMTLNTLTLDYYLTRKGRLVLNSDGEPNWQAVESEDAKVHRLVSLSPSQVVARATSASACETFTYTSPSGQGIFYIPLEVDGSGQQVTVTADYTITAGSTTETGTATAVVGLTLSADAGGTRNLSITLNVP